jgi:hypothetical protein
MAAKSALPVGKWVTGAVKRLASGKIVMRTANPGVRRNVEQGFYDQYGFHPIRASSDYSAARAGESGDWRRDAKRKKKKTATKRKAAPKRKASTKRKAAPKRRAAKKTARRRR